MDDLIPKVVVSLLFLILIISPGILLTIGTDRIREGKKMPKFFF